MKKHKVGYTIHEYFCCKLWRDDFQKKYKGGGEQKSERAKNGQERKSKRAKRTKQKKLFITPPAKHYIRECRSINRVSKITRKKGKRDYSIHSYISRWNRTRCIYSSIIERDRSHNN